MTKSTAAAPPFAAFDPVAAWGQLPAAALNVEALIAFQRKNLDAISEANRLLAEGVQEVSRRGLELLRQAAEEAPELWQDLLRTTNPEEFAGKQIDLAKRSFERAGTNARELTALVSKTQEELSARLGRRVTEGLEEIRSLTSRSKQGNGAAAA
jgi:phasin family protein